MEIITVHLNSGLLEAEELGFTFTFPIWYDHTFKTDAMTGK